jgi:geranylgeranyl pyrophosphate synthase
MAWPDAWLKTGDNDMFTSDTFEISAVLNEAARIGGLLGDATAYHLASGGKAWRAGLAASCGHALGVQPQDHFGLSVACELVHQASVVHDDIQDEAPLRRGRASVAARFGAPAALCVGDHLLVTAFAQLAALPAGPALIRLFGAGISTMAAAQAEEFPTTLWPGITCPRYEALVAGKAGAMMVLPIAGAALLAGLPAPDIDTLSDAARILGMAYQMSDDIDDLASDIAAGSLNGVIVRGLDAAGETERAWLLDLLARARRERLSHVEAGRVAARLQQETRMTRNCALALLSASVTELRDRSSPLCHSLIPVIAQAAEMLANNLTHGGETRHAA